MIGHMSETPPSSHETPEPATGPVATAAPPPPPPHQPTYVEHREPRRQGRLSVVAAWVGIVTGVVVTVAVVFFSGYFIGAHSTFGHHDRGDGSAMMHRQGPPPMMFPMQPRNQFNRPPSPFGPGLHIPGLPGAGGQPPGQGPGPQPPGGGAGPSATPTP
jgi:hypothetical protein